MQGGNRKCVPFGVCDWNADAPAGLRCADRNSARVMHRALPLPMSLFYATVASGNMHEDPDSPCLKPAGPLIASKAKHSEPLGPALLRGRHADMSRTTALPGDQETL